MLTELRRLCFTFSTGILSGILSTTAFFELLILRTISEAMAFMKRPAVTRSRVDGFVGGSEMYVSGISLDRVVSIKEMWLLRLKRLCSMVSTLLFAPPNTSVRLTEQGFSGSFATFDLASTFGRMSVRTTSEDAVRLAGSLGIATLTAIALES